MKSDDINTAIPDIHTPNNLDKDRDERIFSKTHFVYSRHHPQLEKTAGSIYIMRHPKDVLLSNFNYFRLTGHTQLDSVAFARTFIRNKGIPVWQQAGMGTWPEHVESWTGNPAMPQLVLKYEDLKRNPEKHFYSIIEFLDNDVDTQLLEKALLRSSFDNMKRIENKEKRKNQFSSVFWGNPETARQGLRFLNKGGVDQKLEHLDPDLDQEFDLAFESELIRHGYR
jgi:hypothetical protein